MDQRSFEEGLKIGLRTAVVILRQGGGLAGVEAQVQEMDEMIAVRRGERVEVAQMVEGDLFLATPLAHPGDLGLTATDLQEAQVALSRLRWIEPATISTEAAKGSKGLLHRGRE